MKTATTFKQSINRTCLKTAGILTSVLLLTACGGSQAAPSSAPASAAPASAAAKPASTSPKPAASAAAGSASAKPAASAAAGSATGSAAAKPAPASAGGSAQASAPSGSLTKVRFRYPVQTGAWIPFMVARDANVFQKYGLDVDVQLLQSPLMVPAMLNHEMDIAATSAETVISAHAKGADLTMVGAMIPEAVGYLVVTGDITKVEDLKGKTVVLNSFGNVSEFAYRRIFAKYNMELGKDVQVRAVQTTPGEIAALAAGNAQGFMAYAPDDVLAKRAIPTSHSIFDVRSLNLPYIQGSIFTNKSYLAANRPVMVNFLKAVSEAISIEKKDHDFAAKTYMKYAKLEDKEVADRALDFYSGEAPAVPAVSPEGVKNVMEVVAATTPEAAKLDPASVIDTSITDELTRSGFADQFK